MIPQAHRQEMLQRAYVTAVAACAGIKVEFSAGPEYGVDGEFRLVTNRATVTGTTLLSEDGYPLDFQMKSTTRCRDLEKGEDAFSFDCDINSYNKLVLQNQAGMVPVLLLILCLPKDESEWLSVTDEVLSLRKACYWHYVDGPQSTGKNSQVVRIPRSHLFTPDALKDIMSKVQRSGDE